MTFANIIQASVPNTAIVGDSVDVYIILENSSYLTSQAFEVTIKGTNIPQNASTWAKPTIQPRKQQTVQFSFLMPQDPVTLWFEVKEENGAVEKTTTYVIVPKSGVNQPTIQSAQPTAAPGTAPPVPQPVSLPPIASVPVSQAPQPRPGEKEYVFEFSGQIIQNATVLSAINRIVALLGGKRAYTEGNRLVVVM